MKNLISKIVHLFIPVVIMLSSIVGFVIYDKTEDQGGWGKLVLFCCFFISVVWFFVEFLMGFIKKEPWRMI